MKRNKRKIFIFVIVSVLFLCLLVLYFQIFSPRMYTNQDFQIENYYSLVDKDNDGIDDQTDILKNTREYIARKPKYKSKYYATGYPDDEYGVCTDVVAIALKGAGYDLMNLVNDDVAERPSEYDIEVRDKRIDFRRVSNLNVYFSHHAISLSTNIWDIDKWQGGDIVVFPKHIGIVSDKRNRKGISYVIHHANPFQLSYEEDILENQTVIGHYRIS